MRRNTAKKKNIAAQILRLQDSELGDLKKQWQVVYKTNPPKHTSRDLLFRAIAHRLQENEFGKLKPTMQRRLSKMVSDPARTRDLKLAPWINKSRIKPGTRLLRMWKGKTHVVTVLERGFEYDGNKYGSLSQIAREIAGTRWSGPKFFGLKTNDRSSAGKTKTATG